MTEPLRAAAGNFVPLPDSTAAELARMLDLAAASPGSSLLVIMALAMLGAAVLPAVLGRR